jgi:hypothetical protein
VEVSPGFDFSLSQEPFGVRLSRSFDLFFEFFFQLALGSEAKEDDTSGICFKLFGDLFADILV